MNNIGLNVPITSSWNGKGVSAASKDLSHLDGLAKKVTKTFASYFAISKIVAFGKASVDAFTSEQKATTQLETAFKNLGLQMQSLTAERTIKEFMKMYGVQDDLLIPAMTTFTRVTKSAATATDLLQTALDVSAGTGRSLDEVTNALAKAYGGNTTALVRLGAGLTQADIKGKSFLEIQQQLNNIFKGSAAAAADTYAGKLAKLKTSFGEMQQTIGEGLVNAFANLYGSGDIQAAGSALKQFGNDAAFVIEELSKVEHGLLNIIGRFSILDKIPGLNIFSIKKNVQYLNEQANRAIYDSKLRENTKKLEQFYKNQDAQNKLNAKYVAQDLANQKAITDQKNKQLAADKAKAVLAAAAGVLDVQKAEVQAALLNANLSQDEITRLKLKAALLDDNATAAGKLAQQVLATQENMLRLQQADPFMGLNMNIQETIKSLMQMQQELAKLGQPLASGGLSGTTAAGTAYTNGIALASGAIVGRDAQGFGVLAPASGAPSIQINITDNAANLVDVTTTSQQNNSLSGTPVTISRINQLLSGY